MYEDSEEDESSTVFDLNFCAKQLLSVYLPVTVCIVFVSGSVWTLRSCQEDFLNDHLQQIM